MHLPDHASTAVGTKTRLRATCAGVLMGFLICHPPACLSSALKRDESVVVPPAVAWLSEGTRVWESNLKVWVFEQEPRPLPLAGLRQGMNLSGNKLTDSEVQIMRSRARWFMVDNERGKELACKVGGSVIQLNATGTDGWSETLLRFTNLTVRPDRLESGTPIRVQWELANAAGDRRTVAHGDLWLIPPTGLSVISDIDDTIKISDVRMRSSMLKRTFLRDFEAVPGMAHLYAQINASNNTAFHYVSGSPWPLFVALQEFCRTNGFPPGSFHLRDFRWRKGPLQRLLGAPEAHKAPVIEALFKAWPQRKFILVGDSGESDPEIYGVIARNFPDQVERVLIRDVTNEDKTSRRYAAAFKDVPSQRWVVFRAPGEIGLR